MQPSVDSEMDELYQSDRANDVGVYYGSLYIGELTGDVSADLLRNDESFLTVNGEPIGGCTDSYMNFNIWVSGTQGDSDCQRKDYQYRRSCLHLGHWRQLVHE